MLTHIFQCESIMSVIFPWLSSPHGSLGLAHHRHAYCLWELSDDNTQTLSGPLTLIRSLWCLEGQMVVVAIRAPGLTPLPIAGWRIGFSDKVFPCWTVVSSNMSTSAFMLPAPFEHVDAQPPRDWFNGYEYSQGHTHCITPHNHVCIK